MHGETSLIDGMHPIALAERSTMPAVRRRFGASLPGLPSRTGSRLAIILLASALLARAVTALGAPAIVNFLHFGLAFAFTIPIALRTRNSTVRKLTLGVVALLIVALASALLNSGGPINPLLAVVIQAEPFLLLILIVAHPVPPAEIDRFRKCLLAFATIHLCLAFYQILVLGHRADEVQGLFIGQGAGAHVGGAVALTAGAYVAATARTWKLLSWLVIPAICIAEIVLSDAKQVLAVFVVSLLLLAVRWSTDPRRLLGYLSLAAAGIALVIVAAQTVMPALATWAKADRITLGVEHKLSIFPLLASQYDTAANWFFGLGPGHSVSRLAFMLPDYAEHVEPLGATTSPVTAIALRANKASWLSDVGGSSMWSLFYYWAGLWGDLGLMGVLAMAFLWAQVWRDLCVDDISRFFLINIVLFGAVFAWPEEPGYMLFVVALIGLQAQRGRSKRLTPRVMSWRVLPVNAPLNARADW